MSELTAPRTVAVEPAQPDAEYQSLDSVADLRATARTYASSLPPRIRLQAARRAAMESVATYWTKSKLRHGLRPPPESSYDLSREGLALTHRIGSAAARMTVEDASFLIGGIYAGMLPDDFRSENGVFYTPPAVATRLLDAATEAGVDWTSCRMLDPGCGGGAFLGPGARRMAEPLRGADRRVVVKNLEHRLRGFEIDEVAAWMSAVFLDATLVDALGFCDERITPVRVCNSLTNEAAADVDLVVGNPPYGRVGLEPALREKFARSLFGHANLYGVFLDLAIRHTRPGGVIAYVAPTGFLCGEYFKRLRALLASEAPPVQLDLVSERAGVFDDVLQEMLLAVFKRGAVKAPFKVNFVEISRRSVTVHRGAKATLPFESSQPWIIARDRSATDLVKKMRSMPHRLADWGYRVSTGPLVWNRHKTQLRSRLTTSTVPIIWAEAVSADGSFAFRAARRNHEPYFVPKEDDRWLLVTHPCVLLQRTTAKEQSRRLIAAEMPQTFLDQHRAVTVENHLNMLVPTTSTPAVATGTLAAFLNSRVADSVFRCISGTVAVSAYELESMPLPPPDKVQELSYLISNGRGGEPFERACAALYGAG